MLCLKSIVRVSGQRFGAVVRLVKEHIAPYPRNAVLCTQGKSEYLHGASSNWFDYRWNEGARVCRHWYVGWRTWT